MILDAAIVMIPISQAGMEIPPEYKLYHGKPEIRLRYALTPIMINAKFASASVPEAS